MTDAASEPRPGPLQGVRVVELASEHGALAGKILADLGAEVLVVEPPGGHPSRQFEPFYDDVPGPERSLWWWFYNTGKQSVVLDLDRPDRATLFRSLVQSSDLVLEGEPPGRLGDVGLDYEAFAGDQRTLVWVSITPFGRSSPRSREPITDLTLQAGAGPAWSCGYDDHRLPPVRPGGNQGYHTASLWAVEAAMVALYVQETQGLGQLVDVSMHAACNVTTEAATYEWLVAQATVQRYTFRHAAVRLTPPRLMTAADGRTVIGALPRRASEFRALSEWLVELGLVDQFAEFFFLELGVERGGVQIPEVAADPEAAAIYQAGSDALRFVAEHLPRRRSSSRHSSEGSRRPCWPRPKRSSATPTSSPEAFRSRSSTTTSADPSCIRGRSSGRRLRRGGSEGGRPALTNTGSGTASGAGCTGPGS